MSTMKQRISLILTLVLMVRLFLAVPLYISAEQSSQNLECAELGTQENPYQIDSAESLAAINSDLGAHYVQVCDIDLSGYGNWEPIGNAGEAFSGEFDGGGHIISGLNISVDSESGTKQYVGLFGKSTGIIKNINLVDSNIAVTKDGYYVGSICGYAHDITNCFSSCNINAICQIGGGIVGYADSVSNCVYSGTADYRDKALFTFSFFGGICGRTGEINECFNGGTISSTVNMYYSYLGGIVGNLTGTANQCVNTGTLTCVNNIGRDGSGYTAFAGGISGLNDRHSVVRNSYNSGDIHGSGYAAMVGGISSCGGSASVYECCYNKGELTCKTSYVYRGGIIGSAQDSDPQYISTCYWNNNYPCAGSHVWKPEVIYLNDNYGSLEDAAFVNQEAFVGFDFESIWEFGGGSSYPYPTLRAVSHGQVNEHRWSSGVNTKKQTCTEYGEVTYTCILCGETKVETLLPLGHKYIDGVCDRCGADYNSSSAFNEYLYRASRLMDSSSDEASYVKSLVSMDTPTELMIDLLQQNGFDDAAATWTAFTGILDSLDDVTEIGELHFEQQDVYSAIILSSLEASAEIAVADTCENISKDAAALCQYLHDTLKAADGIVIVNSEDYKNLSEEGKERIKALLEAFFKDKHPNLPMLDDILADFDKFFGAADCLETFTEQFYTYYELIHLTESMKDVLREMYALSQSSTNEYLQYAMKDCVKIMETSAENMYSACFVNEGLRISGRYALKEVVGALWDEVKSVAISYYPAIGVLMVAYHGGKFISNWLCSSDSLVEQYYNMIAVRNIEHLAESAEASLRRKYGQQPSVKSASAFVDSINLLYGIFYEDCDAAYDFCDVVDNATLNQIKQLIGASDYSEVKTRILELKDVTKDTQALYQVIWIDALQYDWPELYDVYRHRLDEAVKPLKEKYREYLIACPVNVYVYDANKTLVAYVRDGIPYSNGNIAITVSGEDKLIHFYDDAQYRVVCEGYDEGTMDVAITEYLDGAIIREATFCNLDVTDRSYYEMMTKGDQMDNAEYVVVTDNEVTIEADFDSCLSDEFNTVSVSINNGFLNTTDGPVFQYDAHAGERISISACVPEGYEFVRWEVQNGGLCVEDLDNPITVVNVGDQKIELNAIYELVNPFADVEFGSFYYEPVMWAIENGITNGTSAATFGPNDQCMRAQVVTFLWRAAGCPEPTSSNNPFVDVKEGDFYYKAVLWAVEKGITNGLDTTHFGPAMYCNRAQVVTFLYRSMGSPYVANSKNPFADVPDSQWFNIPVLWAVENGITVGIDTTHFAPAAICNRAQIATFLYRAYIDRGVVVAHGSCGENVNWMLYSLGLLSIDGTGMMEDYSAYWKTRPWDGMLDKISCIEVKEGVTRIGDYAFSDCNNVFSIGLPLGLLEVGNGAFSMCSKLESIVIPDSVTKIGYTMFVNCETLQDVVLPRSITQIPTRTFYCCTSLNNVVLPEGIIEICDSAFYECDSLKDILLPNGIQKIENYAFYDCSSLSTISIPGTLQEMGECVFENCINLSEIIIEEGVQEIGGGAFLDCGYYGGLSSVTIPSSVKRIGAYAFCYCYHLEKVVFCGDAPVIESDAFRAYYSDTVIEAYYPVNNKTWTSDVMRDYGTSIIWIPYAPNDEVMS